MKRILLLLLLAATIPASAGPETTPWQWQQSLAIPARGVIRLDLPVATIDAAQPDARDLRLLSPTGVETPWVLMPSQAQPDHESAGRDFKATIDGRTTVLTASDDGIQPVVAVTLDSPARAFLKSARIDARVDGGAWQTIAEGEVVFRQADSASRLRIPIPAEIYDAVRITLDDQRSPPVPFTGMRLTHAGAQMMSLPHPVTILSREERGGETRMELDLGQQNLTLDRLQLVIPGGIYSRECTLSRRVTGPDGTAADQVIASGWIFRVQGENGKITTRMDIPIGRQITASRLILIIRNGDSPPLDIQEITASRLPHTLVFFAPDPGEWNLYSGNRLAMAPRYDLAGLQSELQRSGGVSIVPGPLTRNPDYRAPVTLPEVDAAGTAIDLAGWGFRKQIAGVAAGVIRLELDAIVLARARDDLGDLRLVQDGRQIPYVVESTGLRRVLAVTADQTNDKKRPTLTRWKLTLPADGLPAEALAASSPTPLFSRQFTALAERADSLGNHWTSTLGTATWTQSPDAAAREFTLPVHGARLPAVVTLETDNGDNPVVQLNGFRVHFATASILAKIPAAGQVFLYYGNERAQPPRYDLGLVKQAMLQADRRDAVPGDEEVLAPGKNRDAAALSAGSPWLWIALAAVVILLLVVVARLLSTERTEN